MALAQSTQLFYRGISDDKFVGGQGFVADCEDVDIRTSIKGVTLDKNRQNNATITMTDTDEPIIASVPGWSFNYKYSVLKRANPLAPIPIEKYYNTNTDRYVNAIEIGEYKVGVTRKYLNRFTTITDQTTNDMEERYLELSGYFSTITFGRYADYKFGRPLLYSQDMLYVGGGGTVDRIDVSSDDWYVVNTLNVFGDVRFISNIGDYIHIYTNDGVNGYKYIRDGVSSNPSYIYKRVGNPVLNGANMGDFDYIITGTNKFKRMYYYAGTSYQMMYGSEFIDREDQPFNFSPMYINAVETLHNRVYFSSKDVFYVYGNKKASDKPSLTKQFKIPNCDEISSIYLIDDDTVFISYMYDDVAKAIYINLDEGNYSSEGHIETLAYDGGDIETKKQPNRIITGYKLGKTDSFEDTTSIEVYARIDTNKYRVFRGFDGTPTVGDVYEKGDVYYTVEEITDTEIICTRDIVGDFSNPIDDSYIYKISGDGPATINYDTVDNHILVGTITDDTSRKSYLDFTRKYHHLQIKYKLKTENYRITPTLYSNKVIFTYNNIDNG